MKESRRLLRFLERNFRTLPFAKRWLKRYGLMDESAFTDLLESRCLMAYPVFIEASGEWVAQSEHTVYMSKNGPIVLT